MSSEIFRNAPLIRAILELRFPGEAAIDPARARIQQAVRAELPQLFVPKAAIDLAPALQHWIFRSADGTEDLGIAVNSFLYASNAYRGYAEFKRRAQHFFGIARVHVPEVGTLSRVGLRYINHIPMLRTSPAAPIPLRDYLNVGFELPASVPGANLLEVNSVFSVAIEGATLKVVLKSEKVKEPTEGERLLLDFDFIQQQRLHIDDLDSYVEIAHHHTKRIFEDLISPSYLPVMRGDNV